MDPITILHKAQPISDGHVADLLIHITKTLPRSEIEGQTDCAMGADAILLEDLLHSSLPGGTYDRLLGEMLKRKVSHFIVPFTVWSDPDAT